MMGEVSENLNKVGKNKLSKFAEMETFEHVVQAPFNTFKPMIFI